MNILNAFRSIAARASKAAGAPGRAPFPTNGSTPFPTSDRRLVWFGDNIEGYESLVGDRIDYDTAVGLKTAGSVAAACLLWLVTSFNSCPLQVGRLVNGEFVPETSHIALKLIAEPFGQEYDWSWLQGAMLGDYWEYGNAYGLKVLSNGGELAEVQYLPAQYVTPVQDANSTRLVDRYEYRPGGGTAVISYPPERVWHVRYPVPDPDNVAKGRRPLDAVVREIYVDMLGSEVAAAFMRSPRPGGILSPDGPEVEVDEATLDAIKRRTEEITSGKHAGGLLGLTAGVKFTQIAFSPKDLALDDAKRKPEERICAAFQIPPSVVGMGAGLDRSTYSNMAEARASAWEDSVIPLQDHVAASMTLALLTPEDRQRGLHFRYDRSDVKVLQEDQNALRQEARADFQAGLLTIDEARAQQGLAPAPPELTAPPEPVIDPNGQPGDGQQSDPPDPAGDPPNPNPAPATGKGHPATGKAEAGADGAGSVFAAAERFRLALARNERQALTELATAFGPVQRHLADALTALEGAEPTRRSQRLAQLMPQVDAALADLAARGASITTDAQARGVGMAPGHARNVAQALAGKPKPGVQLPWNTINPEALAVLVGTTGSGSPLRAVFDSATGDMGGALRDALLVGVTVGVNPKETARQVQAVTGTGRARLETITRTESLRATREATRQSYEANAELMNGYVRLSARDLRTCPACWGLDGKQYPLRDHFASHPNCRCSLVPNLKSWADVMGDPSLPTEPPTVGTGADAFAALPASAQEAILGPARMEAYRNGMPLSGFARETNDPVWGPTVGTRSAAEAAASVPAGNIAPLPAPPGRRTAEALMAQLEAIAAEVPPEAAQADLLRADIMAAVDAIEKLRAEMDRLPLSADAEYERLRQEVQRLRGEKDWAWRQLRQLEQTAPEARGDHRERMLELLKADTPLKPPVVFDDDMALESNKGYRAVPKKDRARVQGLVDACMSLFEARPLVGGTVSNGQGGTSALFRDRVEPVVMAHGLRSKFRYEYGHAQLDRYGVVMMRNDLWQVPIGTVEQQFVNETAEKHKYTRTLLHELTHWLDARSEAVRRGTEAFFKHRTAGDNWMRSPYGGFYKPDKWHDPYCGQRYDWDYEGGYEIPTRGMERMLENPLKFAKEDFEYFKFVYECVMQGAEWRP